jgi:hypothetical protein
MTNTWADLARNAIARGHLADDTAAREQLDGFQTLATASIACLGRRRAAQDHSHSQAVTLRALDRMSRPDWRFWAMTLW